MSLKCTVFEIFNVKNAMTLKTGLGVSQGHWKFHHSIERIRLPIDVLTMVLFRIVSDIFNVEKCRDLQIGVKGHSRSLRVLSFDRLCFPISVL